MNANYPTAVSVPQTARRVGCSGRPATQPTRTHRPATAGPVQRAAGREMRKALRAAEMEAWEAAAPSTEPQATEAAKAALLRQAVRSATDQGLNRESLLIVLLSAAALIGLLITIGDSSELVSRWSRFVAFIHNLLA